ncbi:hypothetical protein DCAR_0727761 [Daucus carota subsp. sativus]|uniref:Uncharacterized protein n=1 Tax=Daucus carota subsp. sativus TaxID=79200 RepID=A0A164TDD6_DAUCS|nr:hypothetical protein DCAR_0727761 [Daucus carota subsp. sativus]
MDDHNPWADQPQNVKPENVKHGEGGSKKLTRKMSENFEKTKAAASNGMTKVKRSATGGVNWIKVKYAAKKQDPKN